MAPDPSRRAGVLALALALIAGVPSCKTEDAKPLSVDTPATREQIREVWREYLASLAKKDGARAAQLVTPETIAEYERNLQLALTASRTELMSLGAADRLGILVLRARWGTKLRTMSGADLFRAGVDEGLLGKDLPPDIEILRLDSGRAIVRIDGVGELPLFRRAGDRWLVDLAEVLRLMQGQVSSLLEDTAKSKGVSVDEIILLTVAKYPGVSPPTDAIWDPPR